MTILKLRKVRTSSIDSVGSFVFNPSVFKHAGLQEVMASNLQELSHQIQTQANILILKMFLPKSIFICILGILAIGSRATT